MNVSIVCAHDPTEAVSARASGELYVIEVEAAGCTASVLLSRRQADRLCGLLGFALHDQDTRGAEQLPDRDPTQPLDARRPDPIINRIRNAPKPA